MKYSKLNTYRRKKKDLIKKAYDLGILDFDEFTKALKNLSHLVPKKVNVKGKDGNIHQAIRWVDPTTGESPKVSKRKDSIGFREDILEAIQADSFASKLRALADLGIYDYRTLSLLTNSPNIYDIKWYLEKEMNLDISSFGDDNSEKVKDLIRQEQSSNDTPEERENNQLLRNIPIEELWENYERNLKKVINNRHKFAIAYGTGGVGKTFTFRQLVKKFQLREFDEEIQPNKDQYDFVVVSGKITPTQVYAEMYRHRDKLIVFDDCDSFLSTEEVQGFLKAGLDTGETTKISNKSSRKVYQIEGDSDSGTIPSTFSFNGRVIAITNLTAREIDQAIKSRALCSNLTMTIDETIDKLDSIKDKIQILTADKTEVIEVSDRARELAFSLIKKNKDSLGGDINTRTYSNAILMANDGLEDGFDEKKIAREIESYFESVTGSFDEKIRKIKGK